MKKLIVVFLLLGFGAGLSEARRGCCSWHGGVAGCEYDQVVCRDGTYSPSCTCEISKPTEDQQVNQSEDAPNAIPQFQSEPICKLDVRIEAQSALN